VLDTPVPSPEVTEPAQSPATSEDSGFLDHPLPEDGFLDHPLPEASQHEPPPPLPMEREDSGYFEGPREVSASEKPQSYIEQFVAELLDYEENPNDTVPLNTKDPFPRDLTEAGPNEYIYLENDILNFRDKSLHKGTPFQKQYENVKRVTQDFQSTVDISDPNRSRALIKIHENEAGDICEEILQKHQIEGRVSTRERDFLYSNKNEYYVQKTLELSQSLAGNFKAVQAEVVGLRGWHEIQRERFADDCPDCSTRHDMDGTAICSYRNLNGPQDITAPRSLPSWRAMMVGICSFITLPWTTSELIVNYGILSEDDYQWESSSPLHEELDHQSTHLGRAMMERIRIMSFKERLPIFLEWSWEKCKTTEPFLLTFYNFLRVVKSLQKHYLPPIIVVIGPVKPSRIYTRESYNDQKRERAKQNNAARVIACYLGVPLLECQVQRKPLILNPTYEWNNPEWKLEPVYNRNLSPTCELYRRMSGFLYKAMVHVKKYEISKNMATFSSQEIGEDWT
jgi:hypothetical protein